MNFMQTLREWIVFLVFILTLQSLEKKSSKKVAYLSPLDFPKTKLFQKIATGEAKPNNQIQIPQGNEKPFLAPLSVNKIPMVGNKTYQKLVSLGVQHIKTVQEMPLEIMESVLGKNGKTIWLRAQGIDHSPIIPFHERKSISMERTFNKDTIDIKRLKATLQAMAESLAYQLRNANKLASTVTVKIRYSDYQTYTKQTKIPYTSADHIFTPKTLELFDSLYQRRVLIRLIGLRFSGIVGGNYQINLFDDSEKMLQLYQSLDHIKNRFGERSVLRASTLDTRTIGGMQNPFNGEPPIVLAHRKQ